MAQAARRKKRTSTKRERATATSSWSMLLVGLVCGAVLSGLYFGYRENEPGRFGSGIRSLLEQADEPERKTTEAMPEKASRPPPKVNLEFHEVLPNIDESISQSGLIPDEEPMEEPVEESVDAPVAARSNHQYILQAGSYKSERDAERMKANLALAGFEAVIQRIYIDDKGTHYRVRMGPYDSKRKLQLDKKRLAKRGINTIAMQLEAPEEQIKQTY